ncbi:MAG: LamG domain-containing protein [Cyclobacteriaceae bacterium]|nr:LamG domain-containing protein [Cyclobacteriaceae bacterium SS2]
MKNYHYFSLFIFASILLIQCGEKEAETGTVEFNFSNAQNTGARILEETIDKIVISIETIDGELLVESHEINVSTFGTGYISKPFIMVIGEYKITEFLVLNESDEIIYATPKDGSALASLVDNPLPISFQVLSDEITKVNIEVIETATHDPEDLGYSTFSFDIIPTQEILISVLDQLENGDYAFVSSDLTVYFDGDSAFSRPLGDSINVVKVRRDVAEVQLKFASESGSTKEIVIGSDTLGQYRTTPLTVIFQFPVDITSELLAYYPLDNSGIDLSGNNLDCEIVDASPINDLNGNENSAMAFSGLDQYLTRNEFPDIEIDDSLSFSLWLNTEEIITESKIILSKMDSTYDYRGWAILRINAEPNKLFLILRNKGGNGINEIRCSIPFTTFDEWVHLVITYNGSVDASGVNFFINGSPVDKTIVYNNLTSTILTDAPFNIASRNNGNGSFNGALDEIRIYESVLTMLQINKLYNLE